MFLIPSVASTESLARVPRRPPKTPIFTSILGYLVFFFHFVNIFDVVVTILNVLYCKIMFLGVGTGCAEK